MTLFETFFVSLLLSSLSKPIHEKLTLMAAIMSVNTENPQQSMQPCFLGRGGRNTQARYQLIRFKLNLALVLGCVNNVKNCLWPP